MFVTLELPYTYIDNIDILNLLIYFKKILKSFHRNKKTSSHEKCKAFDGFYSVIPEYEQICKKEYICV